MSKAKQVFIYISLAFVLCTLAFLSGMQVQHPKPSTQPETTNVLQETTFDQKEYYAEIDSEYAQQLLNAESNLEVCKIHNRFSVLWKDEIDIINDRINAIASESLQQALFKEQQEWNSAVSTKIDCRLQFFQQIYGSGSIVPVLIAEYECQLYRERAINLNKMYDQIYSTTFNTAD